MDRYIGETEKNVIPVSYHDPKRWLPGRDNTDEPQAVLSNLRNDSTMKAWLADVKLFMKRAGRFHA